jgi:RNA polymerase sigma-70 factor (ECF subfamily)
MNQKEAGKDLIYRVNDSSEQIVDELLVMDCQSGRSKALDMLVSRWQKRLWQHAYRLAGDAEAAWDITQQSWLGIIKGLQRLNDPANFRAWAYKITTNNAIDWIKRHKAGKQISIEEISDRQCKCKESKFTDAVELLEKLDIKKRLVISLYYFEQLSVTEIGAVLNIPSGTVKSRLDSARKEFKELWQKYSE